MRLENFRVTGLTSVIGNDFHFRQCAVLEQAENKTRVSYSHNTEQWFPVDSTAPSRKLENARIWECLRSNNMCLISVASPQHCSISRPRFIASAFQITETAILLPH